MTAVWNPGQTGLPPQLPTVNISVGLTRMSGTNHQPLSLREFAAQLLVNAFFPEAVGTSEAIHFQDENDITSSRLPYVQAAVKLGLISGYADGTFLPKSGLTRAAAAALLSRSLLQEELVSGPKIQIPVLMYHERVLFGAWVFQDAGTLQKANAGAEGQQAFTQSFSLRSLLC